jgi:Gluconate 2-dehydrogenase subunit 3
MCEIERRAVLKGATAGALAFSVGGAEVLLTPRAARAQGVPLRTLSAAQAATLDALGETLVPGARQAGISHFVDQQISIPAEEALLEARILNVRPPYANFYRAALGAVDSASERLNNGRPFVRLDLGSAPSGSVTPSFPLGRPDNLTTLASLAD